MDAVGHAVSDDPRTAGMFALSMLGNLLCWIGISYTPSRIFFEDKLSGVSLPIFTTIASLFVGLMILTASGSRSRFMLKYVGGAPNSMVICLVMFSAYCLNIWTLEHRQDKGFATGILDDSNTAFACYLAGSICCLIAHFYYHVRIASRIAELK
eukprot:TRINITY_DN1025_c0_g1_i1.p1 TRINITY_DN1025_c0_g1~~TRINITY_DN1025_c0_g1_i1.p1  ORF type:complete len:154 (-),score=7.09 TRINITY_DN1025_c0_g1_i1:307-768(-)